MPSTLPDDKPEPKLEPEYSPEDAIPMEDDIVDTPISVGFIQTNFRSPDGHGNFEAIVHFRSPSGDQDYLAEYYFDSSSLKWNGPFPILVDGKKITGVTGRPALIQSDFGNRGNYEMLVPIGDRIRHYWRNNNDLTHTSWHVRSYLPVSKVSSSPTSSSSSSLSLYTPASGTIKLPPEAEFTEPDLGPALTPSIYNTPVGVSFVQSSLGTSGNFEAVVHFRSSTADEAYLCNTNRRKVIKLEFKPLDVSRYCRKLFEKCPYNLIMSATILEIRSILLIRISITGLIKIIKFAKLFMLLIF